MPINVPHKKIGLAVSGGIDSCYLMHTYARYHNQCAAYVVLTVNHGLRPESATEALWVKSQAQALGLECHILTITQDKPTTGIQNFARNARYQIMSKTAKEHHIQTIYLGHHADDQAETILSRLNHTSGIVGLCGMADMFYYDDICFKRPLLNLSRIEIAESMCNKEYINDPSNDNIKYERVRNRQFLYQNPELKSRLIHLSLRARELHYPIFLERNVFLKNYVVFSPYGYCYLETDAFIKQDRLLQQEILKYTIKYVTGNFYIKQIPPLKGKNFTLSNAEICFTKDYIKIFAENRNFVDYNPKRFVKTQMGLHKNDSDIPHKVKQTLPSGYFAYKPQSLHYFVSDWDRVSANFASK